jgi:cytochrome c-type protein NapC/trimethylamine-N-oxide reductase cytochrome c-type subunit TorC
MVKFARDMVIWIWHVCRRRGSTFLISCGFCIAAFLLLNVVAAATSSSEFCGAKCHEMNAAYLSWELSPHGNNQKGLRVTCIGCHLPPKEKFFSHMTAKTYAGAKDVYKHYFGPPYDVAETSKKVLGHLGNKTCTYCHKSLLATPSGAAARNAHIEALSEPDKRENRCVECHPDVGHERDRKLFSP